MPVHLAVRPSLAVSPSLLNLSADAGAPPPDAELSVWNAGSANPVAYAVVPRVSWIGVSPVLGASSGEVGVVTVSVSATDLEPGVHHGAVDIVPRDAPEAAQRVMVQLAVSREGGRFAEKIVFDSSRGGNSDIWMVNPDGSGLTTLVAKAGGQYEPRISPDGLKLAHPHATANRLVVRDLATGAEALYTNLLAGDWMPDGRGLVGCNTTAGQADVWRVPLAGAPGPLFVESDRQTPWGVDWVSGRPDHTTDSGTGSNTQVKVFDPERRTASLSCRRTALWRGQGNVSRDGGGRSAIRGRRRAIPNAVFLAACDGTGERRLIAASSGVEN